MLLSSGWVFATATPQQNATMVDMPLSNRAVEHQSSWVWWGVSPICLWFPSSSRCTHTHRYLQHHSCQMKKGYPCRQVLYDYNTCYVRYSIQCNMSLFFQRNCFPHFCLSQAPLFYCMFALLLKREETGNLFLSNYGEFDQQACQKYCVFALLFQG